MTTRKRPQIESTGSIQKKRKIDPQYTTIGDGSCDLKDIQLYGAYKVKSGVVYWIQRCVCTLIIQVPIYEGCFQFRQDEPRTRQDEPRTKQDEPRTRQDEPRTSDREGHTHGRLELTAGEEEEGHRERDESRTTSTTWQLEGFTKDPTFTQQGFTTSTSSPSLVTSFVLENVKGQLAQRRPFFTKVLIECVRHNPTRNTFQRKLVATLFPSDFHALSKKCSKNQLHFRTELRIKLPFTSGRPETKKPLWFTASFYNEENQLTLRTVSDQFFACAKPDKQQSYSTTQQEEQVEKETLETFWNQLIKSSPKLAPINEIKQGSTTGSGQHLPAIGDLLKMIHRE